jgi:hypothetical protein
MIDRSLKKGRLQQGLRSAALALNLNACDARMAREPHCNEVGIRVAGNGQSDRRHGSFVVCACQNQCPKSETEALNIIDESNKAIAAVPERGPEDYIACLLFRHNRPYLSLQVGKFMWPAPEFFTEISCSLRRLPNRNLENGINAEQAFGARV